MYLKQVLCNTPTQLKFTTLLGAPKRLLENSTTNNGSSGASAASSFRRFAERRSLRLPGGPPATKGLVKNAGKT